jgi:hypothetical protein
MSNMEKPSDQQHKWEGMVQAGLLQSAAHLNQTHRVLTAKLVDVFTQKLSCVLVQLIEERLQPQTCQDLWPLDSPRQDDPSPIWPHLGSKDGTAPLLDAKLGPITASTRGCFDPFRMAEQMHRLQGTKGQETPRW